MNNTTNAKWPDMSIETRAWELAKVALGADADIHALIDRTQQIKAALKRDALKGEL